MSNEKSIMEQMKELREDNDKLRKEMHRDFYSMGQQFHNEIDNLKRKLKKTNEEKEELWVLIGMLRDELKTLRDQNRMEHTLVAKSIVELRDTMDDKPIMIGYTIQRREQPTPIYVYNGIMDTTMNEELEYHRGEFFTALRKNRINRGNQYELSSLKNIKNLKRVQLSVNGNNGCEFVLKGKIIANEREIADYLRTYGIEAFYVNETLYSKL